MEYQIVRKPKFLCLHGFRYSGKIQESLLGNWPEFVREKMELVFIDAPFSARGKSSVEDKFDPPYYEWFQYDEDYSGFNECITYIEDFMKRIGPFDGLLGFSQGAVLSAALPGMQVNGVALTGVPEIKFVILISGFKFGGSKLPAPKLAENAFSSPIECPSLHIIAETEKAGGIELLDSFVDPFVINHHQGHVVPKLDEKGIDVMLGFIEKIQKLL